MVAVRMVSEGVDIPRLAVGVYATSAATPLYFAQAVGRFVRARRRGETASIFLPTVPALLEHAGAMELERDHALDRILTSPDSFFTPEDALLARAGRVAEGPVEAGQLSFEALAAEASFDRVLFDGGEFGTGHAIGSAEEQDYLGLPGLLEPDQVTTLLQQRQNAHQAGARRAAPAAGPTTHRTLKELRKELGGVVGAWHHRTSTPHGAIHAELRRVCGGPAAAAATAEQLQARIDRVRAWATGRG